MTPIGTFSDTCDVRRVPVHVGTAFGEMAKTMILCGVLFRAVVPSLQQRLKHGCVDPPGVVFWFIGHDCDLEVSQHHQQHGFLLSIH